MGIRLTDEETWAFLTAARVGILTTLRADGWPVSLPVWFAVDDRCVYVRTPARAKKVARVRRDPRAGFCVEAGERWVDLKAVVLTGRAQLVDDEGERARVASLLDAKYEGLGMPDGRVPDATRRHYAGSWAFIRFVPEGRAVTWDNARIELGARQP